LSDTSEFSCEVVRILEVTKHPNADRLSIVKIGGKDGPMHYSLVTGDTYVPGDLAIFVGVDSLVPVDTEEWSFCKKRLDYRAGTSHYRIRRAKLRGIATDGVLLSQGLKLSDSVGDDVSSRLDILKYELPESVERLPTAPQGDKGVSVQKLWKRLVPDYSVTNLRKVANLFAEGEMVEYSEKLHGSNIRFGRVRGKLFIGSHHAIKSDMRGWFRRLWDRLLRRTKSAAHYYGSDIWSKWVLDNVDTTRLSDGYVFFGEIFGPGIQKGFDYGLDKHGVRVFDIWDVNAAEWLTYDLKTGLCKDHNLPVVPTTVLPFNQDQLELLAEHPSDYSCENIKEGEVVKSLDGKRRGKWVSDTYREKG